MYKPVHFFACAIVLIACGLYTVGAGATLIGWLLLVLPGLGCLCLGWLQSLAEWAEEEAERLRDTSATNRNSYPAR